MASMDNGESEMEEDMLTRLSLPRRCDVSKSTYKFGVKSPT
jgi:hypothetical protein